MVPTSTGELRRVADSLPSGMPTIVANRQGEDRQLQRDRQAFDQDLADGPALSQRNTEIAGGQLAQVCGELDGDRLIQAVSVNEVVADRLGRPLAERGDARIARQQPGEREDEEDDPEQDRDAQQQPAQDELEHCCPILRS